MKETRFELTYKISRVQPNFISKCIVCNIGKKTRKNVFYNPIDGRNEQESLFSYESFKIDKMNI